MMKPISHGDDAVNNTEQYRTFLDELREVMQEVHGLSPEWLDRPPPRSSYDNALRLYELYLQWRLVPDRIYIGFDDPPTHDADGNPLPYPMGTPAGAIRGSRRTAEEE